MMMAIEERTATTAVRRPFAGAGRLAPGLAASEAASLALGVPFATALDRRPLAGAAAVLTLVPTVVLP